MLSRATVFSLIIIFFIGAAKATSKPIKRLECNPLSATINIPNTPTVIIGRVEFREMYKVLPQNCRTEVFQYSNGVIDYVPHSKRCSRDISELGLPIAPVGYPMEYRASNNVMTWTFRGKIFDPIAGKFHVTYQNKLELDTMILTQRVKIKTNGETATMVMSSICE